MPFGHKISDSEKRTDFLDAMYAAEAPKVLQWIIDRAGQFIKNGHKLQVPAKVISASGQYAAVENRVGNFIAECCENGPGCRERGGRLYEAYRSWAQEQGEYTRRLCRSAGSGGVQQAADDEWIRMDRC